MFANEKISSPHSLRLVSSRKANAFRMLFSTKRLTSSRLMKDSTGKRKCRRLSFSLSPSPSSRFFLYIFLGAIAVLASFLAYQYLLSARVKRAVNKSSSSSSSSNGLAGQQGKGNYDLDWIPKHHLTQSKANEARRWKERDMKGFSSLHAGRSPKPTARERKSRSTNGHANGTGAVSSENDE